MGIWGEARAYPAPAYMLPETLRAKWALNDGAWLVSPDRAEGRISLDKIHGKLHLVTIATDTLANLRRPVYLMGNIDKVRRIAGVFGSHFSVARSFALHDTAATAAAVRKLFRETLPGAISPDDLLVVYVALPAEAGSGSSPTILPFDGLWPKKETIPFQEFYDFSRALPAANAIFIFDLCSSQKLDWERPKVPFLLPWTKLDYVRRMMEQRNRLFILAAEECPEHRDPQNSYDAGQIFSQSLGEALSRERDLIVWSRFMAELRQRIFQAAAASGIEAAPRWTFREGADIFLLPDVERRISALNDRRAVLQERIAEKTAFLQSPLVRIDRNLLSKTNLEIAHLREEMRLVWRELGEFEELLRARIRELERIEVRN